MRGYSEARESLLPLRPNVRPRSSARLTILRSSPIRVASFLLVTLAITLIIVHQKLGTATFSTTYWQSTLFTPDREPGYAGPSPVICARSSDPIDDALLALEDRLTSAGRTGAGQTIWSSAKKPEDISERLRKSWTELNPDHIYRILDDAQARAVMQDIFGEEEVLQQILHAYDGFSRIVMKLDLLRYALLWRYGGVWTDADTVCMQPISTWLPDQADEIHTALAIERDTPYRIDPDWEARGWTAPDRGYQLIQWTMLARPFSPVMRRALVLLMRRTTEHEGRFDDSDILYVTGPRMLTDAALDAASCALDSTPFGWLNISAHPQTTSMGGIAFLPPHSFDADPAHTERGDLQKVEHLYAGSWKTTAYK